jgi:hypothetical protein
MKSEKAPIVMFLYNRPWHTRETIEALKKNQYAVDSDLIIYADGPKNLDACSRVREVRDYIKSISGFKSVTIVERDRNWGLAKNIIDGVTSVVNRYGKIIVMEDDMLTSPHFLKFMNDALDAYRNNEAVWHISGWNYPIDTAGLEDAFLWRVMNCWGWATWSDRWAHFEKDTDKLFSEFSSQDRYRFNLDDHHNFWSQVELNKSGTINTWAIYWYATIFKAGGLCLGPTQSLVQNIGFDGSGEHCGSNKTLRVTVSEKAVHELPSDIREDTETVSRIKDFLWKSRPGLARKLAGKLKRSLKR